MRIALIQHQATADRSRNLARAMHSIDEAAGRGAQLICFPELGFEPFYPQHRAGGRCVAELAEPVPGPTTDAIAKAARRLGVVVVLNLFERAGDCCYDCSPVLDADGRLAGCTRMVHITDYDSFHEQDYYAPGNTGAPVYATAVGKVGVAICYDRHFPEYMRALALSGAELVVVPQAGIVGEWPEGLYEAEMQTAAFQNGYFAALCNRIGLEGRLEFSGESFVCAPDGSVIARARKGEEQILYADLDLAAAARSHARRLFLRHRRPDLYGPWLSAP